MTFLSSQSYVEIKKQLFVTVIYHCDALNLVQMILLVSSPSSEKFLTIFTIGAYLSKVAFCEYNCHGFNSLDEMVVL